MPPKGKYTDPKLRDQVKEEIQQSDKGGAPGQWSARKAQFMAAEYKKRGGGYTTDKENGQDESQKNLDKWTEEEWQTKEGSGEAKKADGTQKRYLPKEAWEQMDESEKQETDKVKQQESKKGKQFVANTEKAKNARKNANEEEDAKFEGRKANTGKTRSSTAANRVQKDKKDEGREDGADELKEDEAEAEEEKPAAKTGSKRGKPQNSEPNGKKETKKQKTGKEETIGSKHEPADQDVGPRGSASRLPKKGQRVTWKAMPGYVHGKVLEIVTTNKTIQGKSVKGSKNDPKIALEADSGKFCVHKPDAMFYE